MDKVTIYTDGACSNNGKDGIGGWAAILISGKNKKEISGGIEKSTNNIAELTAIINSLLMLKDPCEVDLFTDSEFIVNSINKNWLYSWEKKGWKKADGKPVMNQELWQKVSELIKIHTVNFNWVKGHDSNEHNNRCDELAKAEVEKIKNTQSQTINQNPISNSNENKTNNTQKKQVSSRQIAIQYYNNALEVANTIFNDIIAQYNLNKPEEIPTGNIISSINSFKDDFINTLVSKKVS